MTAPGIILLLVTGLGVGFTGGLLGLGGAFIMTPVQYFVYTGMGMATDAAIKLAFGTSLMVILGTALSGAFRHSRHGAVRWQTAYVMGCCGAASAFGGARLASLLPGEQLKLAFGVIVILVALRMLTLPLPKAHEAPVTSILAFVLWSVPVGFVTGIIGVGGGIVMVPVMVLALKFPLHQAVGTSMGVMVFTSIGGIIGYITGGIDAVGLPAYTWGYVNPLAWLLLGATSIPMAQIGAAVSHRIQAHFLRYIFIAIMIYVGLRMLGVFELLGLPF